MVVPLLQLKSSVDGFLCAEFRIVVFSKVFNTLRDCGTLPTAHVSSEQARQQHVNEQENTLEMNFTFEFPCIVSLYYIRNQQDATLAVSFMSHCKITLHVSDAFCVHHQEY